VNTLKDLPVTLPRKRRLPRMVAAGRYLTSTSSSLSVVWSVFGSLPPPFLYASEAPRSENPSRRGWIRGCTPTLGGRRWGSKQARAALKIGYGLLSCVLATPVPAPDKAPLAKDACSEICQAYIYLRSWHSERRAHPADASCSAPGNTLFAATCG